MHQDVKTIKRIVVLCAYIVMLLISVPFIWKLEVFLRAHRLLMITVNALLFFYLSIVVIIFFQVTEKRIAPLLFLIGYSILYAVVILQNKGFDKKIHFIEYGILTYLAFAAFDQIAVSLKRYAFTFLIALIVGFADELLQHFTPGRSFDFGDFLSNVQASALMLILIAVVEKYKRTSKNS